MKRSEKFVRLIIRRPQAYTFRKNYKTAPIPGVAFLDGEGKFKEEYRFNSKESLADVLKRLSAP